MAPTSIWISERAARLDLEHSLPEWTKGLWHFDYEWDPEKWDWFPLEGYRIVTDTRYFRIGDRECFKYVKTHLIRSYSWRQHGALKLIIRIPNKTQLLRILHNIMQFNLNRLQNEVGNMLSPSAHTVLDNLPGHFGSFFSALGNAETLSNLENIAEQIEQFTRELRDFLQKDGQVYGRVILDGKNDYWGMWCCREKIEAEYEEMIEIECDDRLMSLPEGFFSEPEIKFTYIDSHETWNPNPRFSEFGDRFDSLFEKLEGETSEDSTIIEEIKRLMKEFMEKHGSALE